ncbi:MAG: ATP synthase F0 subunit B [Deltaproteobacteria bacterium]|nr:ATP synthase F0 subunit B [Deltaproteobacteria bacterium]
MRAILLLLGFLVAPDVAHAASEAGAAAGIPWWEIFKQVVNFSILVGVLVYFLRKPVSAYLKERSELLAKSIEEAAQAKKSAMERFAAIEARMARLSDEIAEMNRKMEIEADAEAKRLGEAAQAEIERLHLQVKFAAEQEVKKAKAELRKEAAELSARTAEEIVSKTITSEDQDRMVRENIDRIREVVE